MEKLPLPIEGILSPNSDLTFFSVNDLEQWVAFNCLGCSPEMAFLINAYVLDVKIDRVEYSRAVIAEGRNKWVRAQMLKG